MWFMEATAFGVNVLLFKELGSATGLIARYYNNRSPHLKCSPDNQKLVVNMSKQLSVVCSRVFSKRWIACPIGRRLLGNCVTGVFKGTSEGG